MLMQITNRCRMGCPHCLMDSNPLGEMMSEATFRKALSLAVDHGANVMILSGGEPTEHPRLLDFCREINRTSVTFSIATNGMWLGDEEMEGKMEELSRLRNFLGGQIYTNPKWYRLHDVTVRKYKESKDRWSGLKWILDTTDIRAMTDMGRAHLNLQARRETAASPYHNQCLSACVTAAQFDTLFDFFHYMLMQHRFCSPLVDFKGDIHLGESWLCPSIGCNVNVNTAAEIWRAIKAFRPCGRCMPCRRFMEEQTPKMIAARRLLGMEKGQMGFPLG